MTEKVLRCPRCGTVTPVSSGVCSGCGLKMVKKSKDIPSQTKPVEIVRDAAPTAAGAKKDITAMPKLRMPGIERHDAAARAEDKKTAGAASPRIQGMESTRIEEPAAKKKSKKAEAPESDIRSLLMEPGEVDGHDTNRKSPPKAEEDTSMSNLLLASHETFGDSAVQEPMTGERLSDKFGFKPLYNIQDESAISAGPDNSKYDTTGLARTMPSAGGISHRAKVGEGFEDPYSVGMEGPAAVPEFNRYHQAKPQKADDGPPPSVVVHQLRKKQAVRRLFTRVAPMALLCLVFWYAGRVYALPQVLVQGRFAGAMTDEENREVRMDLILRREGRRLTGDASFKYPTTQGNLMDPFATPPLFSEVFHEGSGTLVGEFDVDRVILKLMPPKSQDYVLLQGDHVFDQDKQMVIRGTAENSDGKKGNFLLVRVSPVP